MHSQYMKKCAISFGCMVLHAWSVCHLLMYTVLVVNVASLILMYSFSGV